MEYLLLLFMYLPIILIGLAIFAFFIIIFTLIARIFFSHDNLRRTKVRRIGLVIGFFTGTLASIPLYFWIVIHYEHVKNAPKENAMKNFHQQQKLNGREKYWPAGTISQLEKWVDSQDEEYRDEMRKELAGTISTYIDGNQLATDESDLITIHWLANLPPESWGYSDYVIASARAYLRYNEKSLEDVWHPERFGRLPGHHQFAAKMDYVTYLRLVMTHCSMQPDTNCHDTFTEARIIELETKPDNTNPLNWLERKNFIPPLRKALGYQTAIAEQK